MPDMPGDTFVSGGVRYVLDYGSHGQLRPYTVGPVSGADGGAGFAEGAAAGIGAAVAKSALATMGVGGLAVLLGGGLLVGLAIAALCDDD